MPKTKNSKKWIFIGVIILIVAGFWVGPKYLKKQNSGIDFIVAKKSNLVQEVSVTGKIKSVNDVSLAFETPGKVSDVNVAIGDNVYTGQVLASLYSDDLQARLLRARANLVEEKATLAKIKAGTRVEEINIQKVKIENAKTSLKNAKKDVVNKLHDSYSKSDDAIRNNADQLFNNPRSTNPELGIVVSDSQLKTDIESKRLTMERILVSWKKELSVLTTESDLSLFLSSLFISNAEDDLSQVRSYLESVAFAVNSLTENAAISQAVIDGYKTDIWSARSNINSAIINLSAVQEKLNSAFSALTLAQNELILKEAPPTKEEIEAQEARILSSDAGVEDVLAEIAKTAIFSPISGVVTKVDVKKGEIVSQNAALISIISNKGFKIEANVAEADIVKVSIGDSANVTLDAYGDETVFKADVVKIDPAEIVIEGVPTYKVTFSMLSNDKAIKPGMTANIDILTEKATNIIAIPARAVKTTDNASIVKVFNNDSTISERKVKTGLRDSEGRVEILSGIKEGDRVITFLP